MVETICDTIHNDKSVVSTLDSMLRFSNRTMRESPAIIRSNNNDLTIHSGDVKDRFNEHVEFNKSEIAIVNARPGCEQRLTNSELIELALFSPHDNSCIITPIRGHADDVFDMLLTCYTIDRNHPSLKSEYRELLNNTERNVDMVKQIDRNNENGIANIRTAPIRLLGEVHSTLRFNADEELGGAITSCSKILKLK